MTGIDQIRQETLALLQERSVFFGDFTLSSGAKSKYYIDCRLTTLHPRGAWLVGRLLHHLIRAEQTARGLEIESVGGLTMGADPVALAISMVSFWAQDAKPLGTFSVRKAPKAHGQTRLIEGCFQSGMPVVVIDDVVTRGDSTLKAIEAVTQEGGKVAFVAVLVDRQEGGRAKIEQTGHRVVSAFTQADLLGSHVPSQLSAAEIVR
jgi:orotate phosphoribosyltransferase